MKPDARQFGWLMFAVMAVNTAAAQTPRGLQTQDSVPMALATALAASPGITGLGDPQIFVGAWPEWVASRIALPPTATVLGAAVNGTTVVGVLTMPSISDTVTMDVYHHLLGHSWTVTPPPAMRATFSEAPSTAPSDHFTVCGGDHQSLTGTLRSTRLGVTTIVLRLADAVPGTACDPRMPNMVSYRQPPFPSLLNPPGSTDRGACSAGGQMGLPGYGPGRVLHTRSTAAALLDDFTRQLSDSGWTTLGGDLTSLTATAQWSKPDTEIGVRQLQLSVTQSSAVPQCRDVGLQISTANQSGTGRASTRPSLFQGYSGVPTLYGPADEMQTSPFGCGPSLSGGTQGTATRLVTALAPDALLELYGRQLSEAGWTAISSQRQPGIGRNWSRKDAKGVSTTLRIMIGTWSGDSTCRNVTVSSIPGR